MQDTQSLNISAMGEYQPEYLNEFSKLLYQHACDIIFSHIITHQNITHLNFLIAARWSVLAKLETKLKNLSEKFSFEILLKHSHPLTIENSKNIKPTLSYSLYIFGLLNTEGLHQLTRFLTANHVRIIEISVETQRTIKNPTLTTSFHIKIELSGETSIAQWRENFMLFCDDLNLDAVMEPDKN